MASRRIALTLACVAAFLLIVAGCGVKGMPIPMTRLNPEPIALTVVTGADGVKISFTVPGANRADKVIKEVVFKYAYVPIEEDPACPGCPPVLKNTRSFSLEEPEDIAVSREFAWLDTNAPNGMQAVYQAVLVDSAGRVSPPSALANGFALNLPPAPEGVSAQTTQEARIVSWRKVTLAPGEKLPQESEVGYIVERRGPEGVVALNQRPLTETTLSDYTANPSRTYRYRVLSVRHVNDTVLVRGEASAYAKAAPFGRASSLLPPTDLVGVNLPGGVYLRFEPVADPENKGYLIERREKGGEWEALNSEPVAENTYIDKDVVRGHYYEYRITAVDEEGDFSEPGDALTVWYQFDEEE